MAAVADVDLIMTDVSTPASNLPIGNSATFSAIVHNQGSTSTTVGYAVGIYLSTDATITTADTLIQNKQIYTYLATGASKTVNFTASIPGSVTPGTYYLGAIADTNNAQPETDETNNGFAGASMAVGNTAPTISLTSPAANATVTAPGSFIITADAQDVDNNIADVKFYQGTTLLGTVTAAPYSYTWNNIAEGSYSLTAKVTDTIGATSTSVAVSVTVDPAVVTGIQTYFIHSDHLDTPREVTSTSGTVVWQWKRTFPFGDNMANEDPNNQGTFIFNLRFPGQYYDEETLTHYNVNRDYDPGIGRYLQSDPIGLLGGLNTYGYVGGNPVMWVDPEGLSNANPLNRPGGSFFGGGTSHGGTARGGGTRGSAGRGSSGSAQGSSAARGRICENPSQSPVWKKFQTYKDGTRTNGKSGKDRQYYQWDRTHGDIEVYSRRGNHQGSMNPQTGDMYKPAVPGRVLNDL